MMNIFDKIVESVSPEQGLKREIARHKLKSVKKILNSGYSNHGASYSKKAMKGWQSTGGSTDDDIIANLPKLRERARDLYMGGSISCGALKTARTNIVGSGLKLKSRVDAEVLNITDQEKADLERAIEKEFQYWADTNNCDATRKDNFIELQQLAILSWLMSGDCFVLLPVIPRLNCIYDLRIRILEADRVQDPKQKKATEDISGGVEVDQNGEVIAYHVAQWHPKSIIMNAAQQKLKDKMERIPVYGDKTGRRNIIHLMETERPDQRRGVPFLAPVIQKLKDLSRYEEAELTAAVVSSMFTVFIKTDTPDVIVGEGIPETDRIDKQDESTYELGSGSIVGLGENESIQEANPARPNTAFDGFVTAVCRQIGAGLEIPYELLIKHFTASYSASRAALLEAYKMFKMRRQWLANDFCQPIYEEFLAEAVAKGRINAPGFFEDPFLRWAYCKAEWNGPSMGMLNPLNEVNAAKIRVQEGFSTIARETTELTGGDWEENHKQRVLEQSMRLEGNLITENSSNVNIDEQPQPDQDK